MALTRWEPKDVFGLRRDLDSLFDTFMGRGNDRFETAWIPPMDVSETENTIEIKVELPGMKSEDITVQVANNVLTVAGEKKEVAEKKEEAYHIRERSHGKFSRSVTLPSMVNAEKISARYDNGMLVIGLPKAEAARSRKIEVKAS